MFELGPVQDALKEQGLDGWLLYDFKGSNPLARSHPRPGRPQAVLAPVLLPGSRRRVLRSSWSTRSSRVRSTTCRARSRLPEVAGAGSWRRRAWSQAAGRWRWSTRLGTRIPTSRGSTPGPSSWSARSASRWSRRGISSGGSSRSGTTRSGRCTRRPRKVCRAPTTWRSALIADRVSDDGSFMETDVQKAILDHFEQRLTTDGPPIVGVGPHSGDPHYETTPETELRSGRATSSWSTSGPSRPAPGGLRRLHEGRLRGHDRPGRVRESVPGGRRGAGRRDRLVREAFAAGRPLRGRRSMTPCRKVDRRGRLRPLLQPPDRPQHRPGRPRQRRPPRQPRDPRRPPDPPPDLLLDRARNLPPRIRSPDRGRHLHRRRWQRPRDRRRSSDDCPANPRLETGFRCTGHGSPARSEDAAGQPPYQSLGPRGPPVQRHVR